MYVTTKLRAYPKYIMFDNSNDIVTFRIYESINAG